MRGAPNRGPLNIPLYIDSLLEARRKRARDPWASLGDETCSMRRNCEWLINIYTGI